MDGIYEPYYNEQNQNNTQNVSGTGNKNFTINGNPSMLLAQFTKVGNDGDILTANIIINNTITDTQSINDSSSWILLQHDF